MLQDLLKKYYNIPCEDVVMMDNRHGILNGDYIYFIISADDKEAIYMEQTILAYYLEQYDYPNLAIPIQTVDGKWFVEHHDKRYLGLRVNRTVMQSLNVLTGAQLATFHERGSNYQYEPTAISSYGQWKTLWANKLDAYEHYLQQQLNGENRSDFQVLGDYFSYIIGISENAIQYVQETEDEHRFNKTDQGTIAFDRYQHQRNRTMIWSDHFVYDHPARDIAEYIRDLLLKDEDKTADIHQFLQSYQSVRPLSMFGWRLVYARLIFPAHLFDYLEQYVKGDISGQIIETEWGARVTKQNRYEKRLGQFLNDSDGREQGFHIPTIDWLNR